MARSDPQEEPFTYKTRAEQRLDWLKARRRPLTECEQSELYQALHAIYVRECRHHHEKYKRFGQARNEELQLLAKVQAEYGR